MMTALALAPDELSKSGNQIVNTSGLTSIVLIALSIVGSLLLIHWRKTFKSDERRRKEPSRL